MMLNEIKKVMYECGGIMRKANNIKEGISTKEGIGNFVTKYDQMIQDILQERLGRIYPEALFIGEEGEDQASVGADPVFIVDPIDGTMNFLKGYQSSAVSVALNEGGKTILGIVYNPYLDEMFYAEKGKGAFLNDRPIEASSSSLQEGLLLFGTSPYYEELRKASFDLAYHIFQWGAMDVRRSGSAAIDICNLAAGRAELFFEMKLQPWDYAAAGLILQEAGGFISDMAGRPVPFNRKSSVLAGGKGTFSCIEDINKIMSPLSLI